MHQFAYGSKLAHMQILHFDSFKLFFSSYFIVLYSRTSDKAHHQLYYINCQSCYTACFLK